MSRRTVCMALWSAQPETPLRLEYEHMTEYEPASMHFSNCGR